MSYDPRVVRDTSRYDEVDRELVRAEQVAARNYVSLAHGKTNANPAVEDDARPAKLHRHKTEDSVITSSTESEHSMSRIATVAMARNDTRATRVKTHPLEDHRTETHRLQQTETVGARKSKDEPPLPNFGGGKPYPPDLPPYEDYVVEFDGPDDPLHPQNWTFNKKFFMGVMLSYASVCSTFTSSLFSASTTAFAQYFHISTEVATLSTSVYVLGYAFGPLVWGPFSELKGRKLPLMTGMLGFTLFAFATATAFNLQTFYICRFFCGVFGSCPLAIVAATFSDMFDNKQRGPAVVIFSATVFVGPMLAPFIGGFVQMNRSLGWRWNVYIPGIMGALSTILIAVFLQETYPPIVLVDKAALLRRRTKNWGIHAKQEEVEVDFRELLTKNFTRPLRLLFTEPVVLLLTIYMSFIYGLLYLFLTAYPIVFQGVHGFNPGIGGLPFFGMLVGIFIVASYIVFFETPRYNKRLDANDGIPVAEWRLPPVIIGGVMFTIGLFWFGWTGYTRNIHWIVPTLSGLCTGFGLLAIFIQCFNYLIDTYLMFAASVVAGNTFLRSIAAAGFPLFARQMFQGLGIQYAATLLGGFAALLVPIPICFYLYGSKLREKSKFAPTMKSKGPPSEASESDADNEHRFPALYASKSRADGEQRPTVTSRASARSITQRKTRESAKTDLEKGPVGVQ